MALTEMVQYHPLLSLPADEACIVCDASLRDMLNPRDYNFVYTDFWRAYQQHIAPIQSGVSEELTIFNSEKRTSCNAQLVSWRLIACREMVVNTDMTQLHPPKKHKHSWWDTVYTALKFERQENVSSRILCPFW